jgi:uncharacterized membrane protein (UPF0127 family)
VLTRNRAPALLIIGGALLLLIAVAGPVVAQAWFRQDSGVAGSSDCTDTAYVEVDIETRPRVWIEVADSPAEHQVGLMFRESMPTDNGMLFVYDRPASDGYWMRNTYIPLSIAWIDSEGTIVDIQDMQPLTDDVHTPRARYWYALEVNQGWFFNNGVGVGQRVTFCLPVS